MTGTEPVMLETLPQDIGFELYGIILITATDGDFELSIAVQCRRPFAQALTAATIGSEDETIDEEIQFDALQEILNVMAGRVQNSCLERRIEVSVGFPKVSREPLELPAKPLLQIDKYYRWNQDHYFLLNFRVNTHTGPSKESNDDENAS